MAFASIEELMAATEPKKPVKQFTSVEELMGEEKPSFWNQPLAPRWLSEAALRATPLGVATSISRSPISKGIAEGGANVIQGLTTPLNIGLIAGTAGTAALGGMPAALLPRLIAL